MVMLHYTTSQEIIQHGVRCHETSGHMAIHFSPFFLELSKVMQLFSDDKVTGIHGQFFVFFNWSDAIFL